MNGQINQKNGSIKPVVSRLRHAFAWRSPNQRLASIVGGLLLIVTGNLVSTVYWDVFSVIFSGFPWLGRMIPWAIAALVGVSTDIVMNKLLDRFRPRGKYWPERENPG